MYENTKGRLVVTEENLRQRNMKKVAENEEDQTKMIGLSEDRSKKAEEEEKWREKANNSKQWKK